MENKKDNPGVYFPPPLIYAGIFIAAIFIQKIISIDDTLFHNVIIKIIGVIFLLTALFFLFRGFKKFFESKNSLITIRPSNSLQTTGIYRISRNPMYIGISNVYLGLSCIIGNWWNIFLFPLLILIIQEYVIKREERYLERRFGQEYLDYKSKVRRWI